MARNKIKASIIQAMRQPRFVSAIAQYGLVPLLHVACLIMVNNKITNNLPNILERNCRPRTLEMVFPSPKISNISGGVCPQNRTFLPIFHTQMVGQSACVIGFRTVACVASRHFRWVSENF